MSELIRTISMLCPLCELVHDVEERKHIETTIIKEENVDYEEIYYVCNNTPEGENNYVNGKLADENILRAKDAYQEKMKTN